MSINHASRRRVDFFGPFFSRGIFGGFRGIFGTFFAKTASYRLVEKNPKNVKKVSKFFRKFSKKKKSINSASQRGGVKKPQKKGRKKVKFFPGNFGVFRGVFRVDFWSIFGCFFDRFTLRNISFNTSGKSRGNRGNFGKFRGSPGDHFGPLKTVLLIFGNGTKSIVRC